MIKNIIFNYMNIILLIFNLCILSYFFIKFIYFRHLLFFIDLIADIITRIALLLKVRNDVIEYNLNLVFPNMIDHKYTSSFKEIKFKSTKLFIINMLIALHQRFVIDTDCLLKYYHDINSLNIPPDLKDDLKRNKVIFALAHYGIYYDFTSAYKLISPLSCIYKMKYEFVERLVYDSNKFENKILPIKHDRLGHLIYNEYPKILHMP